MSVQINEIIGRSEQGITKPFICRGDDNEIYFVKGRGAGRRSLICEWVAGNLGLELGLPVAPFAIVDVPEALIMLASRDDLSDLGAGLAFGSVRQQVVELSISHVQQVPELLRRDVLAFDWWIRNGDRTLTENGGNPNLFWDVQNCRLTVLDHNQAFDLAFSVHDFIDTHVFRQECRALFQDWIVQEEYAVRYINAMSIWQDIWNRVPFEWWFVDAELTIPVDFDRATLMAQLLDCRGAAFWNMN